MQSHGLFLMPREKGVELGGEMRHLPEAECSASLFPKAGLGVRITPISVGNTCSDQNKRNK